MGGGGDARVARWNSLVLFGILFNRRRKRFRDWNKRRLSEFTLTVEVVGVGETLNEFQLHLEPRFALLFAFCKKREKILAVRIPIWGVNAAGVQRRKPEASFWLKIWTPVGFIGVEAFLQLQSEHLSTVGIDLLVCFVAQWRIKRSQESGVSRPGFRQGVGSHSLNEFVEFCWVGDNRWSRQVECITPVKRGVFGPLLEIPFLWY